MDSFDFNALRESLGFFGFLASSVWWSEAFFVVRRVLAVLAFIFIAGSVWIFIMMWQFRPRLYAFEGDRAYKAPKKQISFEEEQRKTNRRKWDSIIKKAESAGQAGYPMAIIEADIMLEDTMGRLGFLGKNLAERLRSATPADFSNIDSVWEAHKLRNRIAHEPNFRLTRDETTKALGVYKKALEDLRVI